MQMLEGDQSEDSLSLSLSNHMCLHNKVENSYLDCLKVFEHIVQSHHKTVCLVSILKYKAWECPNTLHVTDIMYGH